MKLFATTAALAVFATTAALAVFATTAFAAPTQLELNIGIDADDYGKFSAAELVVIKSNMESERSE